MIYLDNAATTLKKPPCVIKTMAAKTKNLSANAGRGGHYFSREAALCICDTAEALSRLFNISIPERIAFTNNATAALNFAITGVLNPGDHVVCTALEHNSVLRPLHSNKGITFTVIYPSSDGIVDPSKIENAISPNTRMIICTHASNVCGTIQPVKKIGEIAKKHNLIFMVDAAQTAGCVKIDVEDMKIDLLAFSGHKGIMGPIGTGGLYVSDSVRLKPIITGGTGSFSESLDQPDFMPDMLQSGTMNTPAIAALGSAVNFLEKVGPENIYRHETFLAKKLFDGLKNIPLVTTYASPDFEKRNGTVSFNISNLDSASAAQELDEVYSIAVRAGYHCAFLAHKSINTQDTGTIRASFGYYNKESDVDKLLLAVKKIALH